MCSTPFGITVYSTKTIVPEILASKPSAQRLSASQSIPRPNGGQSSTTVPRAQRLSASQSIPRRNSTRYPGNTRVLNAFRHHSLFHNEPPDRFPGESSAQRLSASQSIPQSTTKDLQRNKTVLNAFRHHSLFHRSRLVSSKALVLCSTPFGITVYSTLLTNRMSQQNFMCSTPFGITVYSTLARREHARPGESAQRLSASQSIPRC